VTTLDDITSPEASRIAGRLLVVPLGATEQHGPHLSLTTDTVIAVGLANALARELPDDVVVAPPLAYGASGEHQSFAGTLSIGCDVMHQLLVELCRSATCTWPGVLLLCAHGGNVASVTHSVRILRSESRDIHGWFPPWKGDAHAGHVETSVMLALASDRVSAGLAAVGETASLPSLMPRLRAAGVRSVSANGVLGDATTATCTAGRSLVDQAVADLVDHVRAWRDG